MKTLVRQLAGCAAEQGGRTAQLKAGSLGPR
jgi:hypothetical protein